MIVGLLIRALGALLDWVSGPLPTASISLSLSSSLGELIGERAGPLDQVIPLVPMAQCLVLTCSVVLPAYAIYTLTVWLYKHLPLFGKG